MGNFDYDYDLFVIGSGPAGCQAALQAARLGKRVGVAEKKAFVDEESYDFGTISSKLLREAVFRQQPAGQNRITPFLIDLRELIRRIKMVCETELNSRNRQLQRHGVDLHIARAVFMDDHHLRLDSFGGDKLKTLSAEKIILAMGAHSSPPQDIQVDKRTIFQSEDVLYLDAIPKSMIITGGGIIGLEYATIFHYLGVEVTVLDAHSRLLPFVDSELIETLVLSLQRKGMQFLLNEKVNQIGRFDVIDGGLPYANLSNGDTLTAEKILYCMSREGVSQEIGLDSIGVETDEHGFIHVNEAYQTSRSHIYAIGDVIGFPNLASTAIDQGRRAANHAFSFPDSGKREPFPIGVYTIPEMSAIGQSEDVLKRKGIRYAVGKAYFRDLIKGQILADELGFLKILFDPQKGQIFGIHILGEGASELIHVGQAVMELGGTIDYFTRVVINYPTLTESYRLAAQNGLGNISSLGV